MTVLRALPTGANWDALILATDIDTNMIATGHAGRYDAEKVSPVPPELARRFIIPVDDDTVEMAPALKQIIRFRPLNLLDPWPMRGKFDVIFCRNVVIYFDKDTQRRLFDRYAELLKPEGWLFIGHSESLFRVSDHFRHLGRTTYRKVR
jgi:chemotaxis protein methyltransferase CheR